MKAAIKGWVEENSRFINLQTMDNIAGIIEDCVSDCMGDIGPKWVSVADELPEAKAGQWSAPVIAMCDAGLIYRLSYFGGEDGCWQRTNSFRDNTSKRVTHWMPLPSTPD